MRNTSFQSADMVVCDTHYKSLILLNKSGEYPMDYDISKNVSPNYKTLFMARIIVLVIVHYCKRLSIWCQWQGLYEIPKLHVLLSIFGIACRGHL